MAEYLHEEALPEAQDTELLRKSGHWAVLPVVMAVRASNSVSPALRWQVYLEAGGTQQVACPSLLPLSITSHPQTLSEGQVKHKASQEPLSQTL